MHLVCQCPRMMPGVRDTGLGSAKISLCVSYVELVSNGPPSSPSIRNPSRAEVENFAI